MIGENTGVLAFAIVIFCIRECLHSYAMTIAEAMGNFLLEHRI